MVIVLRDSMGLNQMQLGNLMGLESSYTSMEVFPISFRSLQY